MTNSFASSNPHKVVLIHGLNNNLEGFFPLRDALQELGLECIFITLPGHDLDRNEAKSFHSAFHSFDQKMKSLNDTPYFAIAFSQGALFLQLWLELNQVHAPKAQVLLAPALYVNNQQKIKSLISFLPSFAFIISQTPKKLRRYLRLFIWEYRTLLVAIEQFQKGPASFKIPTLVLVDPKDELIHAKRLEEKLKEANQKKVNFEYIQRPTIKAPGLGKHHILFHPDYFQEEEWNEMLKKIISFFNGAA